MVQNKSNISEISKFFINNEAQTDLADFLAYIADEVEGIISAFDSIDLNEFDNLDYEVKEDIISGSGLWFAANITANEVNRLLDDCEQVVLDYRSLSEALLQWEEGGLNPLTDSNLMSLFYWEMRTTDENIIYELKHKAINLLGNYMLEDLSPYYGEAYFTKDAIDYITESIID